MSGDYRDEGAAAHAANDSLRRENAELAQKLASAERARAREQQAHQEQLRLIAQGQMPPRSGANPMVVVFVAMGIAVLMAAGMSLYLMTSRPPPPPEPVQAPAELLPSVQPVPPVPPVESVPAQAPTTP
ncbi:MAG: hypothetical protein Q8Q09_14115 [Deltaproteobacteria bacterium]|nr:hypothetical protein [Deltaproteobacteria bacterium]